MEQYEKILAAIIRHRGDIPHSERSWAEQWILYGHWTTSKLTTVGLEYSDFFPEDISLSRSQMFAFRRQLWAQAHNEADRRAAEKHRENRSDEQSIEGALNSYKELLIRRYGDVIAAERRADRAESELKRSERENDDLRRAIAKKNREIEYLLEILPEEALALPQTNDVTPAEESDEIADLFKAGEGRTL